MICEGLGLEPWYCQSTSEIQLLSSNFYPPCPNPSLTLGILPHQDPSLITILYQGNSTGLQVMKDGQWINVGAIPNAFVVNIGNQLEVSQFQKVDLIQLDPFVNGSTSDMFHLNWVPHIGYKLIFQLKGEQVDHIKSLQSIFLMQSFRIKNWIIILIIFLLNHTEQQHYRFL